MVDSNMDERNDTEQLAAEPSDDDDTTAQGGTTEPKTDYIEEEMAAPHAGGVQIPKARVARVAGHWVMSRR
jgi:hypothetical protein